MPLEAVFFSFLTPLTILFENSPHSVPLGPGPKGIGAKFAKGTLKLSEAEANLISLFVNQKSLANSKVMSLFIEKSKTKDYAVKRKNRTLTGLNKRFSELYGTSLFYNQKSKTDSRQTNYLLNQKINLKKN